MFKRYLAGQLIHPNGFFGRHVIRPLWNRHNAALNDETLQHLHLGRHERVLDVGFGGGYLLAEILAITKSGLVAGLDASPLMVEQAQQKLRSHIQQGVLDLRFGTVENLPFADACFDKICSVNSIFYWSDLDQGLNEILRVLRKNGLFVLTYTVKEDLEKRGFSSFGIKSYPDEQVLTAVQRAGFRYMEIKRSKDAKRRYASVIAVK